jgi:hypothetical protein
MNKWNGWAAMAGVLLASCGGGEGAGSGAEFGRAAEAPMAAVCDAASPEASSVTYKWIEGKCTAVFAPMARRAADAAQAPLTASVVTRAALMAWAERQYPQYFSGISLDGVSNGYDYRYYPATRNYIAINSERVYVVGPLSNGTLLYVGMLQGFGCQVYPTECAGSTGGTSTSSGDVAGDASTTATVESGSPVTGTIDQARDVDWYAVSLSAGTAYTFNLEGISGLDTVLSLRDASGALLASNDDIAVSNLNSRITYTPTSSGRYFLAAAAYGSSTGGFRLSVTGTTGGGTGTSTGGTGTGDTGTKLGLYTPEGLDGARGPMMTDTLVCSSGRRITAQVLADHCTQEMHNYLTQTACSGVSVSLEAYTASLPLLRCEVQHSTGIYEQQYTEAVNYTQATVDRINGTSGTGGTSGGSTSLRPSLRWSASPTQGSTRYVMQLCYGSSCDTVGGQIVMDTNLSDGVGITGSADGLRWSPSSPVQSSAISSLLNNLNQVIADVWTNNRTAPNSTVIRNAINNALNSAVSAVDAVSRARNNFAQAGYATGSSGGGTGTGGTAPTCGASAYNGPTDEMQTYVFCQQAYGYSCTGDTTNLQRTCNYLTEVLRAYNSSQTAAQYCPAYCR